MLNMWFDVAEIQHWGEGARMKEIQFYREETLVSAITRIFADLVSGFGCSADDNPICLPEPLYF